MAEAHVGMRAWCAVYQWPGRKKFLFGTAWLRHDAPMHEVEAEVAREFAKAWGEILPDGWEQPKLLDLRPGMLVFVPEKEAHDG